MNTAQEQAQSTFPCPGCGNQMLFVPGSDHLKCSHCGNEKQVDRQKAESVEHELVFSEDEATNNTDWGPEQHSITCRSCTGVMLVPASQTATVCAFCGSPNVLPQGDSRTIRPESVIPFLVSRDQAVAAFNDWKSRRWFVPEKFKNGTVTSALTGIYVPYWTFDASSYAAYTAQVGYYKYRTETRTRVVDGKVETYTENVRYTDWYPTSGDCSLRFDDVLIPASDQFDLELLWKLGDFDLGKLVPYAPDYLSGFVAQRYTATLQVGWSVARERMNSRLEEEIKRKIGGDEISNLSMDVRYADQTYKHILLPVWNATYRYNGELFRFMVNGQTASVTGRVPRSEWKILGFVLCWLFLAIFIFILFQQSS